MRRRIFYGLLGTSICWAALLLIGWLGYNVYWAVQRPDNPFAQAIYGGRP